MGKFNVPAALVMAAAVAGAGCNKAQAGADQSIEDILAGVCRARSERILNLIDEANTAASEPNKKCNSAMSGLVEARERLSGLADVCKIQDNRALVGGEVVKLTRKVEKECRVSSTLPPPALLPAAAPAGGEPGGAPGESGN